MIKKFLLLIALFTIIVSLASCGGAGGGGSSSKPEGVNPGIPSIVQLLPMQVVVQTNSLVYFKAKVLDGNGRPVKNEPVTFINVSPIGTFCNGINQATTDILGIATVCLSSPTPGFLTVRAEVYSGAGQVRDSMTVYFTSFSLYLPAYLTLEVDAEGDGTWDEASDFRLLEAAGDDMVLIRVTVYSRFGLPVSGSTVTFGADVPYWTSEVGCSDGSDTCEVIFPSGNVKVTNSSGQATVLLQVTPNILRVIETLFNVTASADNGAYGMVTLYLESVTVDTVTLSADPSVIDIEGSSTINAAVIDNLGAPVPDDTTVAFTTEPATPGTDPDPCGSIIPFGQTTNGLATVDFTGPSAEGTCTITGSVSGVSDTVDVVITAEATDLVIVPGTWTANGTAGDAQAFTISGGTPPYIVTSTDPFSVFDSGAGDGVWDVVASGDQFTANVAADTCPGDVDLNVYDSASETVAATVTILSSTPLSITPTSAAICENDNSCGAGTDTSPSFTISGGIAPYSVLSNAIGVITNPVSNPFTVNAINDSITTDTTVNLTVSDACGTALPDVPVLVINQP